MSGFESPNYTQAPNDFFVMLPDMSDAELRVTLVMIRLTFGFHRNGFKMGVSKLATAAGLSRQGALDGAKAAEDRGTFKRTNPDAQTEAEWELIVPLNVLDTPLNTVEGNPQPVRGQVGVKERIKKELKEHPLSIENAIATGQEVTNDMMDNGDDEKLHNFERCLGFGALPWGSNTIWTKFSKWVIAHSGFEADYARWRDGDGKYKAFSNKKIRENPAAFIDTGYPEYEASKMYRKTDEARPQYASMIRTIGQ